MRYLESRKPYRDLESYRSAAFWGVARACDSYDPTRGVTWQTYVINCVRWELMEEDRQRVGRIDPSRRPKIISLEDCRVPDHLADPVCIERIVLERLERVRIHHALRRLPERECHLLIRRFWCGDTLAEIGRRMGFSNQRAHELQQQALKRLRVLLEAEEHGGGYSDSREPEGVDVDHRSPVSGMYRIGVRSPALRVLP